MVQSQLMGGSSALVHLKRVGAVVACGDEARRRACSVHNRRSCERMEQKARRRRARARVSDANGESAHVASSGPEYLVPPCIIRHGVYGQAMQD
eukprot:6186707-Pleurochrysis_carterae.AAC.4